jgi:hypothetical protein
MIMIVLIKGRFQDDAPHRFSNSGDAVDRLKFSAVLCNKSAQCEFQSKKKLGNMGYFYNKYIH